MRFLAMLLLAGILGVVGVVGCSPSDQLANASAAEKAPDFELKDLDGNTVKLSDHRGTDVVVLDFWATWCGPCRQALPIVTKVTKEFKDKNVVFYAVDIRESADTVRAFLEERGIDCTALLDSSGATARAYGVRGIPHSVVIDKDGNIRHRHIGLSPNLEATLRSELTELTSE